MFCEVGVKDNGPVKKGQLLFSIDPEPYQLAVRSAEANLAVALQGADVSVADILRPGPSSQSIASTCLRAASSARSSPTLSAKRALAETQAIRARPISARSQADLSRAQADLRKAQASLGAPGLANPKVRQALAAMDQARLDLRNSTVIAPADGIVTNLRLAPGQYVGPGQPVLSFLETGPRWIYADMRENQLGNVKPGQEVLVALDIKPGKLFRGRVHSIGWGVSQGDEAPTGQLSSIPSRPGLASRSAALPGADPGLAGRSQGRRHRRRP